MFECSLKFKSWFVRISNVWFVQYSNSQLFERQNYVKLTLCMRWPPIRYYVFVDFLIRNICYQACFQIDLTTNLLKIRSTHLKKVLRICCCTSPEKTQLKKRLFFIVFIRFCEIKLLLDLFSMWKRHNRHLVFLAGPNNAPVVY